jgi:DNA replication protein DnaC
VKSLRALWKEAEQRDLLSDDPEAQAQAVRPLLDELTGEFCRCGEELPRWCLDGKSCPTCREAKDREMSERERTTSERMAKMGVPPAYQHCTLETFQGEPDEDWCSWVARPEGFLLIMGADTGVAKTHLATAALYSLDSSGKRCFWASALEMARRISNETFDPEMPTHRKSSRVEILLLDDLGAEVKLVHNGPQLLDAVLDERDRYKRPTILTTNLTVEQLYERNPRLASRLSAGKVVERSGLDWRTHR